METGIKILFAVMIALFVAVLYLALIPQKGMEIREDRVMTPSRKAAPASTSSRS